MTNSLFLTVAKLAQSFGLVESVDRRNRKSWRLSLRANFTAAGIIALFGIYQATLPSMVFAADKATFLKQHCIRCHGPAKQSGDRRFDTLTNQIQTPDEAMLWQEILDQLNLGEMPPKKEKQPTKVELLAAVDAITQSLADAKQRFKATESHTELRRLNSFEYQQTIGDLLGSDRHETAL